MRSIQAKERFSLSSLHPTGVCTLVTIIAIVGSLVSITTKNPLWILFFLLPAVIYEVIRTQEGASTKFSSILLLAILILEILLIIFNINFDLATFFGSEEKYIAGYTLPLGDIKIFGPLLLTVLSTLLIFRTRGRYTKWLSIIIALGSLITIYLISPSFFQEALKLIINGLFDRFSFGY
jgi:hypothetical protein